MQGVSITMDSEPKPSESPKKLRKILPRPKTPQIVFINPSAAEDHALPKLRSILPQSGPPPLVTNAIKPKDSSQSNNSLPPLTVINQHGMKVNVVKAVWVPNATPSPDSTIQGNTAISKKNPKGAGVVSVSEKELCCRLCGRMFLTKSGLVDVFSAEGISAKLQEKVKRCLPIMIKPLDELPSTVCKECTKVLDLSFKLVNTAVKTDQQLRDRLLLKSRNKSGKVIRAETTHNDGTTDDISLEADANESGLFPGHPSFDHTYNMRDDRKEVEINSDASHMPAVGVNGRSRCHLCEKTFDNTEGILQHVETDHGAGPSAVTEERENTADCTDERDNAEDGLSDISLMHCSKCKEICLDDEDLQFHLNHECVVCDVCYFKNRSRRAYVLHLMSRHKVTVDEVQQGGEKLASLREAAQKMEAMRQGALGDVIKSMSSEEFIASNRLENGKYQCPTCPRVYDKLQNFKNHLRLHDPFRLDQEKGSDSEMFKCDKCPSVFGRLSNLVQHEKVHRTSNAADFGCLYCAAKFTSRKDRLNHEKEKHSVEFKESMAKSSGITKPKGGRLWICSHCARPLSSKLALIEHERIHTGVKPCICEYCGRSFRTRTNLLQHVAVHTRERAHLCLVCGKGFSRKSFVRQHMRSHTGEKPFECDLCGKRFTQAGDLGRHRRKYCNSDSAGVSSEKKRRLEDLSAEEIADPEEVNPEDMIAVSSISGVADVIEEVAVTAQCELCLMEFPNVDELTYHLLNDHSEVYQEVEEVNEEDIEGGEKEYVLVVPS